MKIGDIVRVNCPGSWVNNRQGKILKLNVWSSDNIFGHLISIPTFGITIVPEKELMHDNSTVSS